MTDRQVESSVEGMGEHRKPDEGQNASTNPVGLTNEGAGPVQDSWTRQAVVDSWNIDAAYDKANKEGNG